MSIPIYDRYGRMKYNPLYHPNNGKIYTTEEKEYLLKYYESIGPKEISLALGRTENSVTSKYISLKKKGYIQQSFLIA